MQIHESTFASARPAGFIGSQAYTDMQYVRRAISKSGLNANRRDALRYIVNLWFYHRNITGEIHPGVEKIAKKLRLSIRTVKSILNEFRRAGFMAAIAYAKGGRKATRYRIDVDQICETLAPTKAVTVPGELVETVPDHCQNRDEPDYEEDGLPIRSEADLSPCSDEENGPCCAAQTAPENRANIAHGYIPRAVLLSPSKGLRTFFGLSRGRHYSAPSRLRRECISVPENPDHHGWAITEPSVRPDSDVTSGGAA